MFAKGGWLGGWLPCFQITSRSRDSTFDLWQKAPQIARQHGSNLKVEALCKIAAESKCRGLQLAIATRMPKGPSRAKITTESTFGTGNKIRYGDKKTLRRLLRNVCFPKEAEERKKKNGTDNQKLRPLQNTTDSSTVVF